MDQRGSTLGRQKLLFGAKRNLVLTLSDVERYGADGYGDPAYVSLYGMPPTRWYAAGVRILGRTAVECTRDDLAQAIARDIGDVLAPGPAAKVLVIDPFLGSGNTLYWIVRQIPGARGLGLEQDKTVCRLTRQNLATVSSSIDVINTDFAAGMGRVSVPNDWVAIVFVAPPWGDALDPIHGLDLRRTQPPIPDIVDKLAARYATNRVLLAIQIHETVDPISLREVTSRCAWSKVRIYD